MNPYSICICGGGHIAHATVAYLSSKGAEVSVFTRRPADWHERITANLPEGKSLSGVIQQASADPCVAADADIVIVAVPRFATAEVLAKIGPVLSRGQVLLAIPGGAGFDWMTAHLVRRGVEVACLQRVPMISRTERYGQLVAIKGYRKELKMVAMPDTAYGKNQALIEDLFDQPVKKITSSLSLTLNSSNPILHPARVTTMFTDWQPGTVYPRAPLFYEEWDEQASAALIHADAELMAVSRLIPEVWVDAVPVCEYYESTGIKTLTAKIRSIPSLWGVKSPMVTAGPGWIPDLSSRYFTEDVPFGTVAIKAVAEMVNVKTPVIDAFIAWMQQHLKTTYLIDGRLNVSGCKGLPIPQNYGLCSLPSLLGKKIVPDSGIE
ncbi:MAG: NAD/NADP octopine/nopaline dehydrogenase family protein [Kiritimatiellae bacterium]|nr:NAD/NADP octopine/nopaline dehydrogenase family protein [Kiritimatiellia bacterium]MDD4341320.1 NAD/NADP octopine/nopaline dehydrogenase family protein [Kiritimatiellia bacterium]